MSFKMAITQFNKCYNQIDKQHLDHTATYICVPITSGKRLFQSIQKHKLPIDINVDQIPLKILEEEVIKPNIEAAKIYIQKLSLKAMIINPSDLYVPRAIQQEYRIFWKRVLEKKVERVLVALDWPFSYGGLYEIKIALDLEIPIYNNVLKLLKRSTIEDCIKYADKDINKYNFKNRPLMRFWKSLHE